MKDFKIEEVKGELVYVLIKICPKEVKFEVQFAQFLNVPTDTLAHSNFSLLCISPKLKVFSLSSSSFFLFL